MRKLKKAAIAAAVFLALVALHFFCPGEPVKIEIPEGAGAAKAASVLKRDGVILSSAWFRALVKLTGTGRKLMPGEYAMRTHMSSEEALWRMTHTLYVSSIKIVIPEGWRMEQIAERLEANGITPAAEFVKLAREQKLEGYLFPSTYQLKKNTPAQEVINLLKSEFERQIRPLFSKGFPDRMDERKTLIIASIVEREAVDESERPLIAAVYVNRYRKGMPLEADPTVQYALGYWKKGLTLNDLKYKSPYNTYAVNGLPPGPICNPGYSSISAALSPANLDALYFVADRKGRHIFNASYQEHLKAKRRVEQAARSEK
jgi:UPF0755 protein